MERKDMFAPVPTREGWKARNTAGAQCLHTHKSWLAALRCAGRANSPTPAATADAYITAPCDVAARDTL